MAQTLEQFGQSIKAKYPQYRDIPDAELGQKILTKYPQYQDMVSGTPTEQPKKSFVDTLLNNPITRGIQSIFPGQKTGEAIGTLAGAAITGAKEKLGFAPSGTSAQYDLNAPTPPQITGDILQGAALIGGVKIPLPTSALGGAAGIASRTAQSALQYGALSGAGALGKGLENQQTIPEIAKEVATAGAIGAVTGGVFNLLGEGVSALAKKVAPTTLSFTSGVPKEAISQAIENPEVARQGVKMPLSEIHSKAVGSLKTLKSDLGTEFSTALDQIKVETGQTKAGMTYNRGGFLGSARKLGDNLTEYGRTFAREFRIGTKSTPEGIVLDFTKSPIVKGGEKANVQEVFNTISNWGDFSARGMQDLAERVGALRNFESGAKTESSVIISKIYNKIAGTGNAEGLIPKFYPELAKIRTNYAVNKKVLDTIDEVLNASKTKSPTAVQSAIGRLDNIFKENKDTYLNIIKELGRRSGVDYLSLLAGGEFQRIMPDFIRGLGGGAAVSVGASLLNPYLILLAPLFSPRVAGALVTNAPKVAQTTEKVVRGMATQAIPLLTK